MHEVFSFLRFTIALNFHKNLNLQESFTPHFAFKLVSPQAAKLSLILLHALINEENILEKDADTERILLLLDWNP